MQLIDLIKPLKDNAFRIEYFKKLMQIDAIARILRNEEKTYNSS